jgi:energy-coupling factor transporter ATP-binding protein EcfA2
MQDTHAKKSVEPDATLIGERQAYGGNVPLWLSRADRRQHLFVLGKTGTGKSTLLKNLLIQDIEAGHGVGLIDPHGDTAEEILDHVPAWRTEHVVYFNPADTDWPIGFNVLAGVPAGRRHLVASGLVSTLKSIWRENFGPRMEYILYAAVAALLESENVTLLGLQRMLVDRSYRAWVVRHVTDPVVRSFWDDEFAHYDDRFRKEAIAPIQNKIGQLLMSPPIRNVLGQVKRKIDPRFMMDDRRIFIANLSKGKLGEDKAALLGSLLINSFYLAALGRADSPPALRVDFHLAVDECHNYATDSFGSILSETRKYGLGLTLLSQFTDQLDERVRNAIFGNVGTLIAFRVGEKDAGLLEREFGGYTAGVFSGLGNFEIAVKTLSAGAQYEPFLGRTHSPLGQIHGRGEKLIRRSREKYATPRHVVEGRIERWLTNKRANK